MAQQPLRELKYTPQQQARIDARIAREEPTKVGFDDFFIAKLGKHFGWSAIEWAYSPDSNFELAQRMMIAANKVDAQNDLMRANTSFFASVSAGSKKPSSVFSTVTKGLRKEAEVTE